MDGEIVEVCIRRSLRMSERKGGGIDVYLLVALRNGLKVPATATLRVCAPDGEWVTLMPFKSPQFVSGT